MKVTVFARRLAVGYRPSDYASHVGVLVDDKFYEFGVEEGKVTVTNGVGARGPFGPLSHRRDAGNTRSTHADIATFNADYNKNYRLFGNSCQTYAIKLLDHIGLDGSTVNELLDSIPGDGDD
eukprot:EC786721.1.p1 GENE.EC786721.1~~EC786721.1.p1  ORF type:complete len:122 (+),score=37.03 EC786721.1:32-397(+)